VKPELPPQGSPGGKAKIPGEQLSFDGMPRRLYSCTPTRLSTWLDCPRRYRMNYLDRPIPPKGPPWAHNSLGAAVHNALAG
jgi:putative RecB family exonuclease